MFLKADKDIYGHQVHFTSNDFRRILDLLDEYMSGIPYEILEIRQDDVNDINNRIDIEIYYVNKFGDPIFQKLLILKGELIDGITFHKRYHE